MEQTNRQRIFSICSYLLDYPDTNFIHSLKEMNKIVNELAPTASKESLDQFLREIQTYSKSKLVSTYIHTFDFGKKTNLYVTYMSNGEQRERGMDLLFLKNYYQMNGFSATDQELPDYLPIILEFASCVDEKITEPIFSRYEKNMKEVCQNLEAEQNVYRHIFKAILREVSELKKGWEGSEEHCLTSSCG